MKFLNHPYILLTLAPLFWGGNAVAGKLAVGEILPFTITFYRWFFGCLILLPFAIPHLKRDFQQIKSSGWILAGLAVVGFTLFNNLMYSALQYTSVINVAIEQAAIPAFVLLINLVLFRQSISWLQVVGLFLAVIGVVITTTKGNIVYLLEVGLNRGDALMVIASLFYAAYSIGLRWRPKIHWMSFLFVLAVSAMIAALPFYLWELKTHEHIPELSTKGILIMAYIVIFPSLIGQLCYAQGVSAIGAARASFAVNLIPIFGAVLAVFLLGEPFQWYHGAGLVCVLMGIALSEKTRAKIPV